MVLFTPLSIRRGGGGEAVDWLVGSLFRLGVRLLLFCLTASEASDLVVLLFFHSAVDLSEPVVVCEDKG